VDLEVEVAADTDRVAGLADRADPLPRPHPLPPGNRGRDRQVGVEVAALLAFAVDQQVVAVEDRVVALAQDPPVAYRDQLGAAGGDDVEALMGAPAVAAGAEFADGAADAMRSLYGKDMRVEGQAAVGTDDAGRRRCGENRKEKESEEGRALQWCAMTRSTMLYSTASSALMK
jgi:hypothetical protein